MIKIIAAAAVLLCLASAAFAQSLFTSEQDPTAGARVFGAKGCSNCHSIEGLGGKIGPDLARTQQGRSFYDLAAAMWNHLPGMADKMRELKIQRPLLSAEDAANLIAFLFTLQYFDRPGNVDAGKRLFAEKKCVVCHQLNGTGGVVGPNLDGLKDYGSPLFIAAAMWNHGPSMAAVMREKRIARPSFRGSELTDLITYIKSAATAKSESPVTVLTGSPERGRRLFADKHCLECHSVASQGGKIGPDLADKALHRSILDFAAAMWNKAPAMLAAMKTRKVAAPRLEPEEMADIVAYLYSVQYFARPGNAKRGREIASQKGCFSCHGVAGVGDKSAPSFSQIKDIDSPATVIAAMWNHSFLTDRPLQGQKTLWPQFRADEMADLAAYLQTSGRGPT
ncbi:MAG TPA: cytochrome c [Verrucomicrobiae bacterium]|jgi:mono/diheme cytochrome c family protein|nr:cytochrome c [Verrucomicrobiae bacterium]